MSYRKKSWLGASGVGDREAVTGCGREGEEMNSEQRPSFIQIKSLHKNPSKNRWLLVAKSL
jgi:hypothetical protein